jgi:putative transposase
METVYIYPLATLRPSLRRRLYEAQQEAARVWTRCRDWHLAARQHHTRWPTRDDLQQATKGQFALHSQTVQMVCHQFLANVDTARELRQTNRTIRYPYKDKRFFPLYWPAQAVSVERGRIVLPMGRGRSSLVFKLELPEQIGGCSWSGRTAMSSTSRFQPHQSWKHLEAHTRPLIWGRSTWQR